MACHFSFVARHVANDSLELDTLPDSPRGQMGRHGLRKRERRRLGRKR